MVYGVEAEKQSGQRARLSGFALFLCRDVELNKGTYVI